MSVAVGDAFLLSTLSGCAFGAVLSVNTARGCALVRLQAGHTGEVALSAVSAGKALLGQYAERRA